MTDTLDIARLTTKQRLDLIAELWDSLAPEEVNLTQAQDAELARRMATFDADAKTAVQWEDIESGLSKRS
jgi:putative addiction module component (TIGR02574 family)